MNALEVERQAKTGTEETTKRTEFFEITNKIRQKLEHYDKVFVVDQPGLGGLEINEAEYLR